MTVAEPLTVMIVDDTLTYRTILRRIVDGLPDVEVLSTATNGKIALSRMQEAAADLVLLDIEMPEMDGLETLKHLHQDYPNTQVAMVSGLSRQSTDTTILALQAGAMEVIPKPEGENLNQSAEELKTQIERVIRQVKTIRRVKGLGGRQVTLPEIKVDNQNPRLLSPTPSRVSPPAPRLSPIQLAKVDVIAIGSSTGGPAALMDVLPKLPATLGVPIFLVQHMPPVFTASLANSLDKKCALTVKEAENGEQALPNTVYIAPGGYHLTVKKRQMNPYIVLTDEPPENSCRPAVDTLFRSVAQAYKENILCAVLTGMGHDGAAGVAIKQNPGNYALTQSEKTCVVYGMPQAVDQQQLSDESLDLGSIANRISELTLKRTNNA